MLSQLVTTSRRRHHRPTAKAIVTAQAHKVGMHSRDRSVLFCKTLISLALAYRLISSL